MTSQEIRRQFLEFFRNKQHAIVPSAPVVPFDDPTLLFTNAGMNQFKDVFLGQGRRDYTRAADTQKCIRVSGKHNDLEEVGYDTYHHTFFEMLGNWSFGDYYKAEAISWAWELLTGVFGLPKERLFATVYRSDDEAFELWKTKTDINPGHILRFDEKDNFWEMGETGPCGPCSEIHINLSDDYNNPKLVNAGSPECIEIWNLVFIQYNRDQQGTLHELPAKHVDTGMGFERLCAVMQKSGSNYDTDVFLPLINAIRSLSGAPYGTEEEKIPLRVIADHIRTLTFAVADGAVPGNEGRGYVLRRILRRAARYGRKLNLREPFLYKLVEVIAATMGDVFPEVVAKKGVVQQIIHAEEESFNRTLDRGIELFDGIVAALKKQGAAVIPGEDAFKLYDTFGFPVDLTMVMAREAGFSVDEARFTELMQQQKTRAREATKDKFAAVAVQVNDLSAFGLDDSSRSEFTGYEQLATEARVTGIKKDGAAALVILDRTPFYVEAGGQIDDHGVLQVGSSPLHVVDVLKLNNNTVHVVENSEDIAIIPGLAVTAQVNERRRWDIMRNHSATHYLHAALRKILGTHVQQAGSYVGPDRLRFDFSHFGKVSQQELHDIETLVNEELRRNTPLQHHRSIPFDTAKKMGALMFFGDKYGDRVNVVQFGDFSMEFCGGTHVANSAQIGLIKIVSETSISSGVRRLEAVTGIGIERYMAQQADKLREADEKLHELAESRKKLEKELADLKLKEKLGALPAVLNSPVTVGGVQLYRGRVAAASMDELKSFGDELRGMIKEGVGVLMAELEGKAGIVCVVSDGIIKEKKLSAGKLAGELAKILGGGGGGKPHLATAGGKDPGKIDEALRAAEQILAAAVA